MSPTGGTHVVRGMTTNDAPPRDDVELWLVPLRGRGEEHELAVVRLHALLLRAARFEAARRRAHMPEVGARELDDLTVQAADDALVAVLARLDSFRGASRFTTWAYKFAIYSTSVTLRRRAWQDREVLLEPQSWLLVADAGAQPAQYADALEIAGALREGIAALTPHQRDVLTAVVLNDVPIDVLADRLGTTRGALYKTLHDARRRLRGRLAEQGYLPAPDAEEAP